MTGLQLWLLLIICYCVLGQIEGQAASTTLKMELFSEQSELKNNVSTKSVTPALTTTLTTTPEIDSSEETSTQNPPERVNSLEDDFELMDEGFGSSELTTDSSSSTNLYTVSVKDIFNDKVDTKRPGEDFKGISIIQDWLKNEEIDTGFSTTEINSFTDYDYLFTDTSLETTEENARNSQDYFKEFEESNKQKSGKQFKETSTEVTSPTLDDNAMEIIHEIVNDVYDEIVGKTTVDSLSATSITSTETIEDTSEFNEEDQTENLMNYSVEVSTETNEVSITTEEDINSTIQSEGSTNTDDVISASTEVILAKITSTNPTATSTKINQVNPVTTEVTVEEIHSTNPVEASTNVIKTEPEVTEFIAEESSSIIPTDVTTRTNEVNSVTTEVSTKTDGVNSANTAVIVEEISSTTPLEASTKVTETNPETAEVLLFTLPTEVTTNSNEVISATAEVVDEIGSTNSSEVSTETNIVNSTTTEVVIEEIFSTIPTEVSSKINKTYSATTEAVVDEISSNVPSEVSTKTNEINYVTTEVAVDEISSTIPSEVSTKITEVNTTTTKRIAEQITKVEVDDVSTTFTAEEVKKIEEETTEVKVTSTTVQPEVSFIIDVSTTVKFDEITENLQTETVLSTGEVITEELLKEEKLSTIFTTEKIFSTETETDNIELISSTEISPSFSEISTTEKNQFLQTTEIPLTETLLTTENLQTSTAENLPTFTIKEESSEEITQQTSTSDAYVNQFTDEVSEETVTEDFVEEILTTEESKIEESSTESANISNISTENFSEVSEELTTQDDKIDEILQTTTQETTQTLITEIPISSTLNLQETTTNFQKKIVEKETANVKKTDKKFNELLKGIEKKLDDFEEENFKEVEDKVKSLRKENLDEVTEDFNVETTTEFEVVETFDEVSSGLQSANIAQEISAGKDIEEIEESNGIDEIKNIDEFTNEDVEGAEEIAEDIEEDSKKAEIAKEDSLDYDDPREIEEEFPTTSASSIGKSSESDESSYEEILRRETSTVKIETTTDSSMYTNPYVEYTKPEEITTEEIDGIIKSVKNIIKAETTTKYPKVTTGQVFTEQEIDEVSSEVSSTTEIPEATTFLDQDEVAVMNILNNVKDLVDLVDVDRPDETTTVRQVTSEDDTSSFNVWDKMKKMFGWGNRTDATTEAIQEESEESSLEDKISVDEETAEEETSVDEEKNIEEEVKVDEALVTEEETSVDEEIGLDKETSLDEETSVDEEISVDKEVEEEIEEDIEKASVSLENVEDEDDEKTETDKEMEEEIEAAIEESSILRETLPQSVPTVETSTNSQDIRLVDTKAIDMTTYILRTTESSVSEEFEETNSLEEIEDFVAEEESLQTMETDLNVEKSDEISNAKVEHVLDLEEEFEENLKEIEENFKETEEKLPENLNAMIKNENGENCLKVNATIVINVNNTKINLPSSARVFGNCSKFVVFSWKPEFSATNNNSISFTFVRSLDLIQVDYMQLNIQQDKSKKITEEFKDFDNIGNIDEDIVFGNGLSVRLGLSLKQLHNNLEKPTSLESSNALALQIASGSVTCIVVLTIIGILAYKKLRSETRIFKVSLDK